MKTPRSLEGKPVDVAFSPDEATIAVGYADNNRISLFGATLRPVFTSSTGRQFSLENPSWNNGAFTKALVEGIQGKADLFNRHSISIKTLDVYITQRVKELTGGRQAPTTVIPESIPDFPIAVVE